MIHVPETRYALTTDGLSIAYQVVGQGALDLLFVPGYQSNMELNWELPAYANLLRRLGSFSRLTAVDRRGTGLSDRLSSGDFPPHMTIVRIAVVCLLALATCSSDPGETVEGRRPRFR